MGHDRFGGPSKCMHLAAKPGVAGGVGVSGQIGAISCSKAVGTYQL